MTGPRLLPIEELSGSSWFDALSRLHDRDPVATPFQHPALLDVWWEAVGRHRRALVGFVLLGLGAARRVNWYLPLAVDSSGGRRVARYLGDPYADYHVLVCSSGFPRHQAVAQAEAFLRAADGWAAVELAEWRHDGEGFPTDGWEVRQGSECPYLDLAAPESVRRVLDKREYAMKARKLARQGKVELRVHQGPDEIGAQLGDFVAMHLAQWQSGEPVGGFDDPAVGRFFRALAADGRLRAHLVLYSLALDGSPVAYYFCFRKEAVCYGYRTTYSTELRRLSPGAVLLRAMVERLAADGFQEFDFTRGGYAYKHRFASGVRHNHRLETRPNRGVAP